MDELKKENIISSHWFINGDQHKRIIIFAHIKDGLIFKFSIVDEVKNINTNISTFINGNYYDIIQISEDILEEYNQRVRNLFAGVIAPLKLKIHNGERYITQNYGIVKEIKPIDY